jgi:DNA-binding IclR family transcriptional regulator
MEAHGEDFPMPIVVKDVDPVEARRIALTENIQRDDLSPAEEARDAAELLGLQGGDRDVTARILGWSRATLDSRLALLNCSAAVLDRTEIVYVLRVPTHKIMTINLSIGSRLPAYCTSMGRVLLSALDDETLDATLSSAPLYAHTPRTVTDKEELKKLIAQVRRQGWAIVDQELEGGLISLSAPIRNRQGRVIAAMNISGNAQRNSAKQMVKAFLEPLQEAAQTVSEMVARRG